MTRKDYRATATILAIFKNSMTSEDYSLLVDKFAYMFQMDNSRFNRDKFRTACEVASPCNCDQCECPNMDEYTDEGNTCEECFRDCLPTEGGE